MARHGHLGEFDLNHGDWKSYVERAKQYFAANGDANRLKEMLRDRLVCGIENDKWQQRLLAEEGDLPFDKALKLLLSLEAAERLKTLQ